MDFEDEEEFDKEMVDEPVDIIKVEEEYEVKSGLLELKLEIILKLTTPIEFVWYW
jgi:hypothetical protein